MKICDYGCGQEAKYKLKNGKWCCSKSQNSCEKVKERKKDASKLINTNELCSYGCNKIANYKMANGKFCCSDDYRKCINYKLNFSENKKGDKNPFFAKTHSAEQKEKWKIDRKWTGNSMYGRNHTKEAKEKIGIKSAQKIYSDDYREKLRRRMLNGLSSYMHKFIKKISKKEIMLRNIVKELYPTSEFQYTVFNYSIDVAIPEYKIAIEYDGYYHFDTEEHKEYHIFRQKRIEAEGWKFYRVTMFDKFPTLEEVKEKINEIIESCLKR